MNSELNSFLNKKAQEAEEEFRKKVFASIQEWEEKILDIIEEVANLHDEGREELENERKKIRQLIDNLEMKLSDGLVSSVEAQKLEISETTSILKKQEDKLGEVYQIIQQKIGELEKKLENIERNVNSSFIEHKSTLEKFSNPHY